VDSFYGDYKVGMKLLLSSCAIALTLCAASANAAVVKVGTAETGLSIPFDTYLGGSYYQQIYNKSLFGTGGNISQISFYNSLYPTGNVGTGNFTLWLSTSNDAISTYDAGFVQFPAASFTQVFAGKLSNPVGGVMTIDLSTLFNYSASQNLVLTIRNDDLSGDSNLFFDVDKNSPDTNSRFSAYVDQSPTTNDHGLVTGFNIAPVPEAATWAMMIAGFAMTGAAMRKRRLAVRFA
jgi:hypothetical protein